MRTIRESEFASKVAVMGLLPVIRVAMEDRIDGGFANGHGDIRHCIFVETGPLCDLSAVSSILLTLSRDESSVKSPCSSLSRPKKSLLHV